MTTHQATLPPPPQLSPAERAALEAAIPQHPRERAYWVAGRLAVQGLTQADMSLRLGLSRRAVNCVLQGRSSAAVEEAIARQVGVRPEKLFRERYSDHGERIVLRRDRTPHLPQRSGCDDGGNIYPPQAA